MTQTDEIYHELMDGLRTGVDYEKLYLKWGGSKGPFYNALQRVLADAGTEFGRVSSELRLIQEKITEAQQKLTALLDTQREVENEVEIKRREEESLDEHAGTARKHMRQLESEIKSRREVLDRADELRGLGFDLKQLQRLQQLLVEIGTKRGLKAKEAIAGFFSDLEDYDAKVGFEREIQRLDTVAETSRLEAQKWQAEKEALERAYKDKKQVVNAMESLLRQGVKPEHISVWEESVQAAGGAEGLSRDLARYKSVRESVAAWEKEIKRLDLLRAERSGEVNALEKRKAETQGAVTVMAKAGIAEITTSKDTAMSELRGLVEEVRNEVKAYTELKAESVRLEKELVCARYLAASDEALSKAPVSIAEVLIRTVTRHCMARGVNPRVPVPELLNSESVFYSFYGGVQLLNLLGWVAAGLATATAEENRSAGGGTGVQIIPRPYRLTEHT